MDTRTEQAVGCRHSSRGELDRCVRGDVDAPVDSPDSPWTVVDVCHFMDLLAELAAMPTGERVRKNERAHLILGLVAQVLYRIGILPREEVYNILRDVASSTYEDLLDMEIAELISCECGSVHGVINGELRCLSCGERA